LNEIDSEGAANKWAHRRLAEKNKLNVADAKHIEEAFRAKLFSFAIHDQENVAQSNNGKESSKAKDGHKRKAKSGPSASVDKSVLMHPEARRIRDRDHVRSQLAESCQYVGSDQYTDDGGIAAPDRWGDRAQA